MEIHEGMKTFSHPELCAVRGSAETFTKELVFFFPALLLFIVLLIFS